VGWKVDPIAASFLVTMLAIYATGTIKVWRNAGIGRGIRRWEALLFAVGWTILALAVLSPLATWSEVLFSLHMTQHELLIVVVAPLLVMARPLTGVAWALAGRSHQGHRWIRAMRRAVNALSEPAIAFTLHLAALWVWHLPSLYEMAVGNDWIHAVEHASYLATACLFWTGLMQGRYGRLGYGMAFLYVFGTALHSGALGALFTVAPHPVYALYAARASAAGLNPLTDQQLAGILMWVPACGVLTVIGLAMFAAWLGELERRNARALGAFTPDN
jgi:cytochrome c oxidase assembly factor CtaG